MLKPWSVQNEIAHRAQRESEVEWAVKYEYPPLPVYKKTDNIKNDLGWRNLLRSLTKETIKGVYQLRP